ncbi:MAG: RnfABCDGE type electron transport complex subunit D [Clostridiales bacterium]|nr:RnfABCDGE type electron transport complex subunit D [Clostridiales bacterium]
MENKFTVSAAPHIHTKETVPGIMCDVIIALAPAAIFGCVVFGYKAAVLLLVCIASCVLAEFLFCKAVRKKSTIGDLSAVVTGLLLGMNLPSTCPVWMAVVGSVFAIIIVKQIFGGLGKNFMNPALGARCFMLIAWTSAMTTFNNPLAGFGPDAVSSATPLAAMKAGEAAPSLFNAFIGLIPGTIGETSAACLLLGAIYLLIRRVISIKIPAAYIITFAVFTYFFANKGGMSAWEYTLMQLCTGGLMLGAFFMATDYTTTPTTSAGMIIFGIGCGALTFLIRRFGGYPEGVSFSIILMNIAAPLIEKATIPKSFGQRGGKSK